MLGCLLAGAIGDALGEGVEFDSIDTIRQRFGAAGLRDYVNPVLGSITDDTQMTLFTLEGLIRAHNATRLRPQVDTTAVMQHAYQRWLHTQGIPWDRAGGPFAAQAQAPDGWLIGNAELFAQRGPGQTCVTALRTFASSGKPATVDNKVNDSKGCGGVMRAAPVAVVSPQPSEVFDIGAASAALTHSHPSGYLPAGVLAVIVRALLHEFGLPEAVQLARDELVRRVDHEETLAALDAAVSLASAGRPEPERLAAELGGGWVGEEALAIAVCAALASRDLSDGLLLAVNHSGDSDSTGAICGNILGALHGTAAIPADWRSALELRAVIEQLCADALAEFGPEPPRAQDWIQRYPPW